MKLFSKLNKIYLSRIIGYEDPKAYWNKRWSHLDKDDSWIGPKFTKRYHIINDIMVQHDCNNILEIGCGKAELRILPNYLGLDFSLKALMMSGLQEFIYADITEKIPLPDNSFDAVFSNSVLLHIPSDKIRKAVTEINRVARKIIILREPYNPDLKNLPGHCFIHDLKSMFGNTGKDIIYLGEDF